MGYMHSVLANQIADIFTPNDNNIIVPPRHKLEWFIQEEKGTNQPYSKQMHIHDDCSVAGENLDLVSPSKYDNRQFL